MKQQHFEKRYNDTWLELESLLDAAQDKSFLRLKKTTNDPRLPELYRRICHHLSLAQQRNYSNYLIERLNHLVLRGHQQLYRHETRFRQQLIRFITYTFPNQVRANLVYFWLATALFYGPTIVTFLLILYDGELIFNFMDARQVYQFESMYSPDAEHVGQDRDSESDVMMFAFYIQNNITVGFQTFATGLIFGLGSLFYLIFNGIYFGAATGHIVNIGYNDTFFTFIIGHCAFELTAITIAGAGGLMLGHAIINPGQQTRQLALKQAARKALDLLYGIIFMLVVAAFFEAFWSSNSALPNGVKYTVGALLWAVVIGYFYYAGRAPATGQTQS